MPRITDQRSWESTVTGWHTRDVSKCSSFPNLEPKFLTSDDFSELWGRLPYRDHLNLAQIYSGRSRNEHMGHLNSCLQKFPGNKTLQVRWRFDKELPAFTMDFLFMYLSKFGKIEAIFQRAVNSCLVLFSHERTAFLVSNTQDLGLPYGRLYTKYWNPLPQDKAHLRMMNHIEKACETRAQFHSLMDHDDRLASKTFLRAAARAMADGNRSTGPHLKAYLCDGVKQTATDLSKQSDLVHSSEVGQVNIIRSQEEFHQVIKGNKLVVVDFFAVWCGPCTFIAPIIEDWAKEFDDVTFAKVDVDEVPEIADECRISAMPTFMFYKSNVLLDISVGAFKEKLLEKIRALK